MITTQSESEIQEAQIFTLNLPIKVRFTRSDYQFVQLIYLKYVYILFPVIPVIFITSIIAWYVPMDYGLFFRIIYFAQTKPTEA